MLSRRIDFNDVKSKAVLHEQELEDIVYALNFTSRAELNALNLVSYGSVDITMPTLDPPKRVVDHGLDYRPLFRVWGYYPTDNLYIPLPDDTWYNVSADTTGLYMQKLTPQASLPRAYYFIFNNPGVAESS